MRITFTKYHGTGNDFVLIDNRKLVLKRDNTKLYKQCCSRRFGIGADGLILLQNHNVHDFEMVYFNADGNESSMCGNGGRCIVAYAKRMFQFEGNYTRFLAVDGEHEAFIDEIDYSVNLKMQDVPLITNVENDFVLNTGSPHYVKFVPDVNAVDVFKEGRNIRNQPSFISEGINVNFVQQYDDCLQVATYERGVEAETFSCGTGVVASALVVMQQKEANKISLNINTKGGQLQVTANKTAKGYSDIWLKGPTTKVFDGQISL